MPVREETLLTPIERRLLSLLALGQTPAQAAAAMQIDPNEAEAILADLLSRHGLSMPHHLIARAIVHRWI